MPQRLPLGEPEALRGGEALALALPAREALESCVGVAGAEEAAGEGVLVPQALKGAEGEKMGEPERLAVGHGEGEALCVAVAASVEAAGERVLETHAVALLAKDVAAGDTLTETLVVAVHEDPPST